MAKPSTKPAITALERNVETQPMRSTPSARAAVYSTAFADPSAEAPTIGVITAAETAQTAALGPCTSWCERPNTAYATSAANAVYRPYCTGTPASVAYARLCG